MDNHKWLTRCNSIRHEHHRLMMKLQLGIITENEEAALSYLQQTLLAVLPMISAKKFETAMKNAELNSLLREPKE